MERNQNHNTTIKHMIVFTIIFITLPILLNGVMASLYNTFFPISTKRIKYILMIPPLAILLWLAMSIVLLFMSIQRGLETYFKEGDE
jgi:E3 ubiquitin-protein ligase DOA10